MQEGWTQRKGWGDKDEDAWQRVFGVYVLYLLGDGKSLLPEITISLWEGEQEHPLEKSTRDSARDKGKRKDGHWCQS